MSDEPVSRWNSVLVGVWLGVLLHLLQLLVVPLVSVTVPMLYHDRGKAGYAGIAFAIMGWSVTQFIYMGPAIAIARSMGRKETAKGILIVAAIGVLLNGLCDALLFGVNRLQR
jgi:hypothetical protein